ncbi:MAG TPA: hypothetical protein VLD39_02515, partial [Gammaproteobacteria bacterium]|nr:hypothetical protein [Gammaproteobacteria bacterium]
CLSDDMNLDGRFTTSDVWLWLVHIFFLPGDGLLWLMLTYMPGLARFLELDEGHYGGVFAAIGSAVVWLLTLVFVGTAYGMLMDLDRALTARVRAWYAEGLRRLRVARRWTTCELRRLRSSLPTRRPPQRRDEIDIAELALSDVELETLRSHALLAPGYVMSASDLAGSLEIRRSQASQLLAKLEKLALLQRSFSTNEGESGYRLSAAGRFVLMARSGHREGR